MEYSSFFNSKNGDRKYLAEDWDRHLKDLISNGVFLRDSANLQVTADGSGMAVTVQPGAAWINGKHYLSDQAIVLSLDIADGALNRVDRVVVQCSTADRTITAKIKKGTPASTAAAPALQRDADIYELSLATVAVNAAAITIRQADITDTRLDTSVCGAVVGLITQVGTDTLYAQVQDDLHRFKSGSEDDFSAWSAAQKNAFAAWRGEESGSFTAWFDNIKGQLSTDAAGHLQSQIDAITARIPENGTENQVAVYGGSPGKIKWQQTHFHFEASVPASAWIRLRPCTQEINVQGLLGSMCPIISVILSDTEEIAEKQLEAYGYISKAIAMDGKLRLSCFYDKPEVDIIIQLEVST